MMTLTNLLKTRLFETRLFETMLFETMLFETRLFETKVPKTRFMQLASGLLVITINTSVLAKPASKDLSPLARLCDSIEHINFENVADRPAVIQASRYVTDPKKSMTQARKFNKRGVSQGMPIEEKVDSLPPHCRIEGYVAPAVKSLALLPEPKNWNKDVLYGACDAFQSNEKKLPGLS